MKTADEGIEELQHFVDTLIIIPNQNLFRVANEKTTFAEAFKMADNVLYSGVRGVTDLMVMPGLINLDFADVRTVMSEMGKAMMGTGEADGETRAIAAAEAAISNPLLDDITMKGARGVLINITGGPDMTLFEVDEAANRIARKSTVRPISYLDRPSTMRWKAFCASLSCDRIEAESVASPRPLPSGLSTLKPKPTRIEAPAAEEAAPAVRPAAQVETPPAVERAAEAELSCSMRVLSRKRSCWKKSRKHRRRRSSRSESQSRCGQAAVAERAETENDAKTRDNREPAGKSRSWQRLNPSLRHLRKKSPIWSRNRRVASRSSRRRPLCPKITARKMSRVPSKQRPWRTVPARHRKRDIVQVFLKG